MSDDAVRRQYEAYPYPPRDPADEAGRLITGSPSHLLEIDHYLFAGTPDTSRPFRALIAGGGTGDATIMLAQQLAAAGRAAEIVYTDISDASLAIARARAEARGLDNLRFERVAIEDLPALGLEPVDYIDCCGVLHHLEDPPAALATLTGLLSPTGGMGLMVYAPLGRTGVYHMQSMMRLLAPDAPDPSRIDIARRLLGNLPGSNWLKRNPFVGDHTGLGDAGLYDLLLHSRDRAYTVGEFADLIAGAGLRIVSFIDPLRYEPGVYVREPDLATRIRQLTPLQRCSFAELACGNMKLHIAYVVKADNAANTVAQPTTAGMIPVLRDMDGAAIAKEVKGGGTITVEMDGLKSNFTLPQMAPEIFAAIDGARSLGEIQATLAAGPFPGIDGETFRQQFQQLYATMNGLSRIFLKAPDNASGG